MSLTLNTGSEVRAQCRKGDFTSPTAGHAPGFVQANLVIVPAEFAYDFLLFCQRNPKPCPILEVLDKGSPRTSFIATDADLRTDLPKYRVYESDKIVDEPNNIKMVKKSLKNFKIVSQIISGLKLACSFRATSLV
ncbi:MAG: hypothetical protein NTZ30_10510 [Planctomycetota bacterium]|nr:hypothetical protein [Planctomycetota bacterium]